MASSPPASGPETHGIGRVLAFFTLVVLIALAWFGYVLTRISPDLPKSLGEEAKVLPVPLEIPAFSLVDQDGNAFDRGRFEGRWSLVFFGYTYCPDICPATLQRLATVKDQLPADTQVVFVSVDPGRDTTERVAEYVQYFHDAFVGVTGEPEEIAKLTRAVGAYNQIAPGQEGASSYLVDHSVSLFVLSPEAELHALMQDPHEPEEFLGLYAQVQTMNRGSP